MLEDKLLILRFKHGSTEALARIYQKYRRYLLKIAAALLHDVSLAEDVVHDVFIRFAQSAETLRVNGSLKAYLRTCVVNSARNKARDNQVRAYVELSEIAPVASEQNGSDRWAILREESVIIGKALAALTYEQREVIVLRLHGQMKFREIARLQGLPIKTIQSRYRYGLDKLRSILDGEMEQ